MKIALIILSLSFSLAASAKSLTCTATLSSQNEDNRLFEEGAKWMEDNNVTDFDLMPERFNSKPVAVDTRSAKLDSEGNGELPGIIIEAYEKHGISYNYAAYAKNGFITYVGAENEVAHSGSGVSNLKNQTEVEFGSSDMKDGSRLELKCEIK